MKLKWIALKLLAAAMATYRRGAPQAEFDRAKLSSARIALVKTDGIGDFILSTTFLQVVREQLPWAEITLFCRRPVGEIARQQFPGWTVVELPPVRSTLQNLLLDGATRHQLKSQKKFDVLLDLRTFRDFTDSTISSWIPASIKLAQENTLRMARPEFCLPREADVYDVLLPLPDYKKNPDIHDLQNYRLLAEYFFPGRTGDLQLQPRLNVAGEEKADLVQRFGPELEKPFVLVCPGARFSIREYPVEKLADAIAGAVKNFPLQVVVAGGRAELALTAQLAETLSRSGIKVFNLAGKLNLAEHTVLISSAKAVVCMETSHAHFAGALGRPGIVIIGGGHFGLFAPWGESPVFRWLTNRVPCFGCHWNCIHDRPLCITDIPPAVIAQNLNEVLGRLSDG